MNFQELEAIWAKILRTLRTNKNFALFGLLSTMNDVEFIDEKIIIHLHNDSEKTMIKQHISELRELSGEQNILYLKDDTVEVHDENRDYIAKLKELFGDKVEIV